MNPKFQDFLGLPEQDRRDVFLAGAEDLDTKPTYIEKDFWVCFVLDILFNGLSGDQPRLLFKGGTSLSKVYSLIRRFSEDVDFTIFRDDLGLESASSLLAAAPSNTARKKKSDEIKEQTSEYICNQLREDLVASASNVVPECTVAIDESDRSRSTLLFNYPSVFEQEQSLYVQPRVKLEGGARSALDPHTEHVICPYIDDVLEDWDFSVTNLTTISAERTFWDKIMILHSWACRHRDDQKLPNDRQRLSRHYYDVAMISNTETGKSAIANITLRDDVREHTQLFFDQKWMKLEEARPGSFLIRPTGELEKSLGQDYQAMQGMMLGQAPKFEDILTDIAKVEQLINQTTLLS